MFDILNYLPGKRKATPSGWTSFNGVCCGDRRQRGGLKVSDQGWSYHCFNCSFTASFILGRTVSFKARRLLTLLNVPEAEIDMLNLESLRHRSIHGLIADRQRTFDQLADISFEERDLPPFAELLSAYPEGDYWDYLKARRVPMDYPYMIQVKNDGIHWTRPHVVIPFTHHDKIVGYTCRFIDGKAPKYISDTQPNYVFGTDLQHDSWQYAIVVEGIFDALSIAGLAVMHNAISDGQARLIRSLGKDIIVVPDQDESGLALVDRAVELGWSVSIPDWPHDVKDVNDAVVKYGKLGALLTILEARETSRIKIELRKKNLVRKLQH